MFFKWTEKYNLAALVFSLFDILTIFYLPNLLLKKSVLNDPVLILTFAATLNTIFAILKYRKLLTYCFFACLLLSVGFLHGLAIILGAPLKLHWEKTLAWAFWQASIAFVPLLIHLGHYSKETGIAGYNGMEWSRYCSCLYNQFSILICSDLSNPMDTIFKLQCLGSLLLSWFSSFVLALDWRENWQKWPLPNILGALMGHFLFGLIGILYYFLQPVTDSSVPRIKRAVLSEGKRSPSPIKKKKATKAAFGKKNLIVKAIELPKIKTGSSNAASKKKVSISPSKKMAERKSASPDRKDTKQKAKKMIKKSPNGRKLKRGNSRSPSSEKSKSISKFSSGKIRGRPSGSRNSSSLAREKLGNKNK